VKFVYSILIALATKRGLSFSWLLYESVGPLTQIAGLKKTYW